MQAIYLDMDGTIADLYNQTGWLDCLHASDATPYRVANPLVDMKRLARVLNLAQGMGIALGIISWVSKGSSLEYAKEVRAAKKEWLARHLPNVAFDDVRIVNYGRMKQTVAKYPNGLLIDDSPFVCASWGKENTLDAKNPGWLDELARMVEAL